MLHKTNKSKNCIQFSVFTNLNFHSRDALIFRTTRDTLLSLYDFSSARSSSRVHQELLLEFSVKRISALEQSWTAPLLPRTRLVPAKKSASDRTVSPRPSSLALNAPSANRLSSGDSSEYTRYTSDLPLPLSMISRINDVDLQDNHAIFLSKVSF